MINALKIRDFALRPGEGSAEARLGIRRAIENLTEWLERNEYKAYDTFDGLSSPILRPLTLERPFLRTVLQQGVRRLPVNIRPIIGIRPSSSTKAMGFLAKGFLRMHMATQNSVWWNRAESAFDWLENNQCEGYSGACWGNHFDYQSRTFYLPKGVPTIVWTALIGHAFLDGYEHRSEERYLKVAVSACEHILNDLDILGTDTSACISYIPGQNTQVHNANTLGASLLARTSSLVQNDTYAAVAKRAIRYTAEAQRPDGSWFYGEAENLHWIDNFHTAYVLDCLKFYRTATGDREFDGTLEKGYDYWKRTFFLTDGTPRYYSHKTLPIDIQCCSQAIDTLVFFSDRDPLSLELATRVALWTIDNMQDPSGYFYYRRYSTWMTNRTPTLHWGQATMLSALAGLYKAL